jgi:DNA primase
MRVDEIKDKLDIAAIIGKYVKLERAGGNFKGLCPFHQEKTPSFVVFPDSQRWQCFGACNAGGDVFDFVVQREGWDFKTALAELARAAGVRLPEWSEKAQQAVETERGQEAILDVAVRFWESMMWAGTDSPGLAYARGRGWDDKTIKAARLGYWDGNLAALRAALSAAGVDLNAPAAQAVLRTPGRSLIYPHCRYGRSTYYATRSIVEKKHWNLPRALVGEKRPYFNWLWNHRASAVVIVEGQGDAVSLGQLGIAAAARAGSTVSEMLMAEVRGRKGLVFVGVEGNPAGEKALDGLAALVGPLARVLRWSSAWDWKGVEDANDVLARALAEGGRTVKDVEARVRRMMQDAQTWIDVLISRVRDAEDKDAAIRDLFQAIARLDSFGLARIREQVARDLDMSLGTVDGLLRAVRAESGLDADGQPIYLTVGGRISRRVHDRLGGDSIMPLCNFEALIVRDVMEDDGEMQVRRFTMAGKLADGAQLPEVEIEAGEFTQMNWVLPKWGARAQVCAGGSTKDHLRAAIQALSQADGREVDTRYEYSHLGWRQVGSQMIYLHGGGAIGMEGIQVRIFRDLARYVLPGVGGDVQAAMKASLKFLDVAKWEVTIPLWSAMYLAPLSSLVSPSFTIWIFGETGSMKSTLTALALCHYGNFSYNTPPASWETTAGALEKKAFLCKDAPLWIDDYTTKGTAHGMNDVVRIADQLLRSWGNRSGRARLQSSTAFRSTYPPRGLVISTAEILPPGQSILSRLYTVEVSANAVTRGAGSALTVAQTEEQQLYSTAMVGYITWLASRWDGLEAALLDEILKRTEEARAAGQHLRMPRNAATMLVGLKLGLEYAQHVGAISADDCAAMIETGWRILLSVGEMQHEIVVEEQPVEMYMSALEQLFAQGVAYLQRHDSDVRETLPEQTAINAEMLGWFDDYFWYLIPRATYNAVREFYRAGGTVFPDTDRGIRSKLAERQMLLPQGDRFTYVLSHKDNTSVRVLRIKRPIAGNGNTGNTDNNGNSSSVDVVVAGDPHTVS